MFTTGATAADHARVWGLCQHITNVDPEPLDATSKYKATLLYNVRFRTDHATNLQLQQLFTCLKQDPTVPTATTQRPRPCVTPANSRLLRATKTTPSYLPSTC